MEAAPRALQVHTLGPPRPPPARDRFGLTAEIAPGVHMPRIRSGDSPLALTLWSTDALAVYVLTTHLWPHTGRGPAWAPVCCGSTQCVRISLTALAKGRWDWDRHRLAGAVSSMPLICPRVGLLHAYMFAYQDRGHRTVLRTVAPRQGPAQHLQDPGSAGPPRPWQQATVHHDQSSHPDERA